MNGDSSGSAVIARSEATRQSPSRVRTSMEIASLCRNDQGNPRPPDHLAGRIVLNSMWTSHWTSKSRSPPRHCAIPLSAQLSAHRTHGETKHERCVRDCRSTALSVRTPGLRDDQPDQRLHARHTACRGAGDPDRHQRAGCRRSADPREGRQSARLFRPPRQRQPFPGRPGERGDLRRPRIHQGHLPPLRQARLHGGRARNLCPHRRPLEDDRHPADRQRGDQQEAGRRTVQRPGRNARLGGEEQGQRHRDRRDRILPRRP